MEKVDFKVVNKVYVDGGAVVNLMLYSIFKKMGNTGENIRPHNTVLFNYEGKATNILGVIHVDLSVGSTSIPILFMVIKSNTNHNLLLGRE